MIVAPKSKLLKQRQGDAPTIVQILPAMVRGGVERGTVEMADAIQKHGGRAIVISRGGPMVRHLDRLGAKHYQLDVHTKNPFRWPQVRSRLKAILSDEKADLVHVRSRAPAWIALPAAAALNIATVSTVHGRFIALSALKRIYNRKLLKTDHVIAISNYVKDLITSQYVDVKERLTVVHRGVDVDLFNPDNVNQTRIVNFVEGLAIPEDVPVIMLPARATMWKGHRVLLQALAKIKDRPFICLMIGAGDGKPAFVSELVRFGQQLGLEGRFRLTPLVDDMPAALMVADVVAMPSITPEPFGRVALEAQAMGRPLWPLIMVGQRIHSAW
jgi:glycosyltransferase involved in cell wall biosynthesis